MAWTPRRLLREVPLAREVYIRARMMTRSSRTARARESGVLYLVYHGMQAADRPAFARQLKMLREHGQFVGLSDSLPHLAKPARGKRLICLTFDDGRQDAAEYALPMLADQGIPATLFVVPDWIDRQQPGIMDWMQVRRWGEAGFEIGSHGLTHRRLALLDQSGVMQELRRSRERVEGMTARPCQHFAAPFGQPEADYRGDRDPMLARSMGYRTFCTTIARGAVPGESPWALPRVRMEPGWGPTEWRYALWR